MTSLLSIWAFHILLVVIVLPLFVRIMWVRRRNRKRVVRAALGVITNWQYWKNRSYNQQATEQFRYRFMTAEAVNELIDAMEHFN